jgi:hypothetical protein
VKSGSQGRKKRAGQQQHKTKATYKKNPKGIHPSSQLQQHISGSTKSTLRLEEEKGEHILPASPTTNQT